MDFQAKMLEKLEKLEKLAETQTTFQSETNARFDTIETTMFAMQTYMHEELVTKAELDEQLGAVKNELLTHIDGLAAGQKTCDIERAAISVRLSRHDDRLSALESR